MLFLVLLKNIRIFIIFIKLLVKAKHSLLLFKSHKTIHIILINIS